MFTSVATANNMKAATASVAVCAQNMSENTTHNTNMSVRTNWRGERSAHISNETRFETRFSDTSPALFWGECVR